MIVKSSVQRSVILLACVGCLLVWCGCSALDLFSPRFQGPEEIHVGGNVKLIEDLAAPYGMFPVRVEGIGLITGLPDTGSDASPSPHRTMLLKDMKARGIDQPSHLLARKDTALVMVMGVLRPGIQKGDTFDLELRVPSQSETTSLRGGWLLDSRLRELAILQDHQIHEGRDWGIADGPVLVDPCVNAEKNPVLACRGLILGGGRALRSRSLGLVLKPDHQNVFNADRVQKAINKRFYSTSAGGIQEGMANAINDQYVELTVHPRYKDNIPRYMQVVRSLAVHETSARRLERVTLLEKQLLDPITSAQAALQLEAIGHRAIPVLEKGLKAMDAEVRFRSAEALAYLDQSEAAEVLGEAARNEPAFRVFALTALGTMNDPLAYDQLCSLLDVDSAETRYGAFRALCTMNPYDQRVMGEELGEDKFSYHVISSTAPPMIHVTRSHRAEIVLFGSDQRLMTPLLLEAGPRIRVTNHGPDQIVVSRYAVGEPDQRRTVSTKVDEVIRAIAELKGSYPDVVQALQQARMKGVLTGRFEVDAIPQAGRTYVRPMTDAEEAALGDKDYEATKRSLLASLTGAKGTSSSQEGTPDASSDENSAETPDSTGDTSPVKRFFAKMTGQASD